METISCVQNINSGMGNWFDEPTRNWVDIEKNAASHLGEALKLQCRTWENLQENTSKLMTFDSLLLLQEWTWKWREYRCFWNLALIAQNMLLFCYFTLVDYCPLATFYQNKTYINIAELYIIYSRMQKTHNIWGIYWLWVIFPIIQLSPW